MSGLFLLASTAYTLTSDPIYLYVVILLLCPFYLGPTYWKNWLGFILFFSAIFLTTSYRCPSYSIPGEKIQGKGIFSVHHVKLQHSPFQRSLVYQGLLQFESEGSFHASQLPCQIYLPHSSKRPLANCDYEIEGTLIQKSERFFILKPNSKKKWRPIDHTFSLAEWRFCSKQKVYHLLQKHIPDKHALVFLNALATGEIDDRALSLEFSRVGMQHILAISGFHFALIALFIGGILRAFFSWRVGSILLLVFLSSYCFFLGYSPSVLRAWIAIFAFLIGQLLNLRITALNALGIGLWVEILFDPLVITHLGFQLSFLCTLGILMLYPFCLHLCSRLFPKRSQLELSQMPLFDQHGYLIICFFRQALAINCAVQIASLPVLLFLFHRFACLSLAYNFFFPFWVSISMLLLVASFFFSFVLPPFGLLLYQITGWWTKSALQVSSNPPALVDFVIRFKAIPYWSLLLYLIAIFLGAIVWNEKEASEQII